MANEADPAGVLVVKTSVSGRLIGLSCVGLGSNLEVRTFDPDPDSDYDPDDCSGILG